MCICDLLLLKEGEKRQIDWLRRRDQEGSAEKLLEKSFYKVLKRCGTLESTLDHLLLTGYDPLKLCGIFGYRVFLDYIKNPDLPIEVCAKLIGKFNINMCNKFVLYNSVTSENIKDVLPFIEPCYLYFMTKYSSNVVVFIKYWRRHWDDKIIVLEIKKAIYASLLIKEFEFADNLRVFSGNNDLTDVEDFFGNNSDGRRDMIKFTEGKCPYLEEGTSSDFKTLPHSIPMIDYLYNKKHRFEIKLTNNNAYYVKYHLQLYNDIRQYFEKNSVVIDGMCKLSKEICKDLREYILDIILKSTPFPIELSGITRDYMCEVEDTTDKQPTIDEDTTDKQHTEEIAN